MTDKILDGLYDAIVAGQAEVAAESTQAGLDAGVEPLTLLFDSMIPALEEVGHLFETDQIFLPEMLISARAMQASMNLLRPLLADAAEARIGTFVMGTVAGDIHDIGKNLCNVMLEGVGFEVIDLGVNVPAEEFVKPSVIISPTRSESVRSSPPPCPNSTPRSPPSRKRGYGATPRS